MGEAEKFSRFINPFILHLQKLELELNCPACLNLLSQPTQLPCNHVFCSHCISNMENDLRCPLCKMSHTHQDLRLIPHLQNIIGIFKNMSAAFDMSDTQWSSDRLMNSNTADVIPQMVLMNNRNGKRPRGRPRKKFLDNEPNRAVRPATEVETVGKCKNGETCNRELNLQAQSQANTPPPFSNNKDSDDDDNNVGFTGYEVIPSEQNVDETIPNIDTTKSFRTSLVFDSRAELVKWVKKVGRSIGVVIVVGRSDVSDPRRAARVILICERGGKPDERGRKSNTARPQPSTKKCGCPFKLYATEVRGDERKWCLTVICGLHNHALITNSGGHTFAGKLLEDEYEVLQSLTASGMRPREILSHLKSRDPSNVSSIRTIYNARKNARRKKKMRVLESCDPTPCDPTPSDADPTPTSDADPTPTSDADPTPTSDADPTPTPTPTPTQS